MADIEPTHDRARRYTCSICHCKFPLKKSLIRHVEGIHRPKHAVCHDCGKGFARRDILNRHMLTQHEEAETKVPCAICGRRVRPRSLPSHRASDACKETAQRQSLGGLRVPSRAVEQMSGEGVSSILPQGPTTTALLTLRERTDDRHPRQSRIRSQTNLFIDRKWYSSQISDPSGSDKETSSLHSIEANFSNHRIILRKHSILDHLDSMFPSLGQDSSSTDDHTRYLQRHHCTTTPDYLPAIADPVLLGAWLFVKLKPWGVNHCWPDDRWLDRPIRTFVRPEVEVLQLREIVYQALRKAGSSPNIINDPFFPDAIIMFTFYMSMTDGWASGLQQVEFLVLLASARMQTAASGASEAYRTTVAVDAFRTVLSRYVKSEYVLALEGMFTMAQTIMRNSAMDTIEAEFDDCGQPVWKRVYLLDSAGWYQCYKEPLLEIKCLAESIPRNIERVHEVVEDV